MCLKIRRLNIVKFLIFTILTSIFNTIPHKILAGTFVVTDKMILMFIWEDKWTRIAKTTLEKNKKRGIILPAFKTYCESTVIKTVQYWWRGRHIDQQNRMQSPEIDTIDFFGECSEAIQWAGRKYVRFTYLIMDFYLEYIKNFQNLTLREQTTQI